MTLNLTINSPENVQSINVNCPKNEQLTNINITLNTLADPVTSEPEESNKKIDYDLNPDGTLTVVSGEEDKRDCEKSNADEKEKVFEEAVNMMSEIAEKTKNILEGMKRSQNAINDIKPDVSAITKITEELKKLKL